MKVAVTTGSASPESSWHVSQLRKAFQRRGDEIVTFSLNRVTGRIGLNSLASHNGVRLDDLDAVVVRPVGRGSVDELFFRMDFLRRLERSGVTVVNRPQAIERAVNKYNALALLEEARTGTVGGSQTPRAENGGVDQGRRRSSGVRGTGRRRGRQASVWFARGGSNTRYRSRNSSEDFQKPPLLSQGHLPSGVRRPREPGLPLVCGRE